MSFFYASQWTALNQNLIEIQGKIKVSFELFPPRSSEMKEIFWQSLNKLITLKPIFISVTYGANAKNFDNTYEVVKSIKNYTNLSVAPHLTCINATPYDLQQIAEKYWNIGVRHIIALRGDLPFNKQYPIMYGADLVALLKKVGDFDISVAAYPETHPEAKNIQADILNLKKKVDAGANRAITQFFFDIENYLRFRDRCIAAGIEVEIIPGILPIFNFHQIKKFAKLTNVKIPNWINTIFDKLHEDYEVHKMIGISIAIDIIKILVREGIKNFHFYTLNRSEMTYVICHMLGIYPNSKTNSN